MIHAHFICYQCDLEKLQLWILLIHKWMIDIDLPKYWLFQKEKKKHKAVQKHNSHNIKLFTQVLFTPDECVHEKLTAPHIIKTHDLDLPMYYTVFSNKIRETLPQQNFKHTQQNFFMQSSVLKQIIALNFISKMHGSDQLITTNSQLQKKKKQKQKKQTNAMQYMITLVQPWFPWRKHLIFASVCALTVVCKFLLIRHEFVLFLIGCVHNSQHVWYSQFL